MEVPLVFRLLDDAGFLQKVSPHVGADDAVPSVEAELDVLAEATAVVIANGLCVSDRLLNKELELEYLHVVKLTKALMLGSKLIKTEKTGHSLNKLERSQNLTELNMP